MYLRTLQPALIVWIFLTALAGCSFKDTDASLVELSGATMGTSYHIKVVLSETLPSAEDLQRRVQATLERVENQMSTYRPDSELSRFNRQPIGEWMPVSSELLAVMSYARFLGEESQGAYDITIGPLVNLWGFGPEKHEDEVPSKSDIEASRRRVDYRALELDTSGQRARRMIDLYVDLSSVAKGFGVDEVARELDHAGVRRYLVEIGGEVFAKGLKPDGSSWRLAIEVPDPERLKLVDKIVGINGTGMATSGDYRNFFVVDGKQFSHTIDPSTGRPVEHAPTSVTVIARNCMEADGLATMFMAMGKERGYAYAVEKSLPVYFIERNGSTLVGSMTPAFEQYLLKP